MQRAFVLKGSLFTLSVLQLLTNNTGIFDQQLTATIAKTPSFFRNTPVLIDLQKLAPDENLDFANICQMLRKNSIIPVGVLGGSESQQAAATSAGLGILNSSKAENKVKTVSPETSAEKIYSGAKVITQQIRSGQQIYAQNTDLIVLSSVSPGAEILADGNIHVYGTLRGRALAGVKGDKNARIFTNSLQAELISVAGIYKINEDLKISSGKQVQVFLKNDRLQIQEL